MYAIKQILYLIPIIRWVFRNKMISTRLPIKSEPRITTPGHTAAFTKWNNVSDLIRLEDRSTLKIL